MTMEQFSTVPRARLHTMLHDRGLSEYVDEQDLPYILMAMMMRIEELEKTQNIVKKHSVQTPIFDDWMVA